MTEEVKKCSGVKDVLVEGKEGVRDSLQESLKQVTKGLGGSEGEKEVQE